MGREQGRRGRRAQPASRGRGRLPPLSHSAGRSHRRQDHVDAHQRGRPPIGPVRTDQARRGPRGRRPDQPGPGLLRRRHRLPGRGIRHVRHRPSAPRRPRRGAHHPAPTPVGRGTRRHRRSVRPGDAVALHARGPTVGLRRRHRGGGATSGTPGPPLRGRDTRRHARGGLPRRGRGFCSRLLLPAGRACRSPCSSPTTRNGPGRRSANTCSRTRPATPHGTPTGRERPPSHEPPASRRWLQEKGAYQILTPGEARSLVEKGMPLGLQPLVGGLPPDLAWPYLEAAAAALAPESL